jgi:hypothetical protein
MLRWIKSLFCREQRCPCNRNTWNRCWHLSDGTPMTHFICRDCGYQDRGHVHDNCSEPDPYWDGEVEVKNGVVVSDTRRKPNN